MTSDYLPTIAEILDHEAPLPVSPIDGVSLLPLLKGESFERTSPIGFQSGGQVTLVENRYKLVRSGGQQRGKRQQSKSKDANWLLFDLLEDPGEETDIASQHPDVVERMSKKVNEWQASCKRSSAGEDYE